MIGIYKITKKENGKSYIGQSNDIERRFSEHKTKTDIPIDIAIQKYGVNAFEFSIIENVIYHNLMKKKSIGLRFIILIKDLGITVMKAEAIVVAKIMVELNLPMKMLLILENVMMHINVVAKYIKNFKIKQF